MRTFPQLSSGGVAQFPIVRTEAKRRVALKRADGSRGDGLNDPEAQTVGWDLTFRGLSEGERAAVANLFELSKGALNTFTFLDPIDNLLRWSEDLSQPVWTRDPGTVVGTGAADAFGGTTGCTITNPTAGERALWQTLAAPGSFRYCFGFWIRSDATSGIQLTAQAGSTLLSTFFPAAPEWARVVMPVALNDPSEGVSFGLSLPAGASVTVCGTQVEAQYAASGYKRTGERAGVYSKTRFDQDSITIQADGPNHYSFQLKLLSRI